MKNVFTTPVAQGITRRAGLLTLLGSALALAGCGGGGDVAGISSGGTGSFSVGPITGIGSIIVNGVRFDDSGDVVRDEDGVSRDRSGLKLGMMVTVSGSAVTRSTVTGDRATATSIVFGGELQGRIEGIPNTALKTFLVLGQTVKVTASTVFDVSLTNGFNSLANDTIVEVHGMLDPATNTLTATFIEKKNSPPALFKIQGRASNHDAIAKKFNIGATRINYSTTPAAEVRVIPTDGTLVRVRLTAVQPPLAAPVEWTATRIRPPENANEDRDEAEIEGSITAFTSDTQFSVNGIAVNATSARFDDGPVAPGMRVEVKGRLSAGVLIAERVKIEDDNEVNNLECELHGTVSNVTLTSFTLTSSGGVAVNVSYTSALLISNLQNGAKVEVRGTVLNASGASTIIVATRITFE